MTNAMKLTIEDGTEYRNGERILFRINDKEWVERIVCVKPLSLTHVTINAIATNPHLFRKLPQVREVPLTNADVLAMLRKGGYEWKKESGSWWGSAIYEIQPNGNIHIWREPISSYTSYRHVSDLIEHPMTKEVEG